MKTKGVAFPLLGGDDEGFAHEEDMLFSKLHPLVVGVTDAKTDFFNGSFASSLKHQIQASLSNLIVPSNLSMPILPNFFLEAKGLEGPGAVVRKQILHNGSLGPRAMHAIQSWGNKPSFYGKASTISVLFAQEYSSFTLLIPGSTRTRCSSIQTGLVSIVWTKTGNLSRKDNGV